MTCRTALAAPLLAAGLLGGLVVSTTVTTAAALADGRTPTVVNPTNPVPGPISGKTGAPLGDANFGADPLVPYGTEPQAPVTPGYVDRDHDNGTTANGQVDLPF